jgi:hypothetical protein
MADSELREQLQLLAARVVELEPEIHRVEPESGSTLRLL